MAKIKRGFRIRLYPNDAQKQQIAVSFGCSRWLWNNMLAMQKERHDNEPSAPYLSAFSMNYLLKQLKREYPWLKDADSTALTGTPEDLHKAYTRFFKGQTRFPKFKSKKHEQSYIS
ncbi:MAG: helix-turn-helix domain-containing protein, partial [Floccifex porci]|uniref:helix-turn-helix domain-containing protein n=1 Tax=Floccifex porci TaxID=2606629 RepID=UPI002A839C0C